MAEDIFSQMFYLQMALQVESFIDFTTTIDDVEAQLVINVVRVELFPTHTSFFYLCITQYDLYFKSVQIIITC
jgi:hypothetical protein